MVSSMISAMTLAGCSRMYFDWNSGTFRHTPDYSAQASPATARPGSGNYSHRQSASTHPHKSTPSVTSTDSEESDLEQGTPQAPAPATMPTMPPGSTISMASGDTSGNAAKVIDDTRQRLARYDRNRLSGSTLTTYDEANGFLSQSKQALAEKDYVAASGFAQKASVLAEKLAATVTPR
jgi:hypothetical protein